MIRGDHCDCLTELKNFWIQTELKHMREKEPAVGLCW